jgi:chorismate synthase
MRFLTAGESHGPALAGIIEGLPAGLLIDEKYINRQLARRQGGYGRGNRMTIEKDSVAFLSGIRFGKTTGSPLSMIIENRDWPNWEKTMSLFLPAEPGSGKVTAPRPGHADLPGGIKYLQDDLRSVLERASARETAMRVAVGAVAALFLQHFGIGIASFVAAIGGVEAHPALPAAWDLERINKARSPNLYCLDREAEKLMVERIDQAAKEGDTLGGVFEIHVQGAPVGLGSHVHWDRRLDARLAGALISIPGIKGVEIGLGFAAAALNGSEAHDELFLDENERIFRTTNRAGGLEGGITNGETIVLRAAMKPIPTLRKALSSVDLAARSRSPASVERADVCAVPAASVVGEAVVSWELARAFLEKFSGDSLVEVEKAYQNYQDMVGKYLGASDA